MKPTPVERYTFTVEEVVASILPNVGHRSQVELRIDADGYVVVDITPPADRRAAAAPSTEGLARQPSAGSQQPAQETRPEGPGAAEQEARALCATPLFRAFLEVKTEEAALKILPERCHVKALADLDRTKSTALNLRYLVEEFEAWKIS
ncbi:UNVERIFIED_ORG: hypothetical protein LHK14_17650 [Roseateles sp. XES5]|nr:hypothetical protein [Roseateles sp. XES5]